MSDEPRPPRPRPAPRPNDAPVNYLVDRRKILVGLGFGLASVAGLRNLEPFPETSTETNGVDVSNSSPDAPLTVNEPAPFEAPVFDAAAGLADGQTADLAFSGGRIIDPETGFDRVGNVGVLGSAIVAISEDAIPATRTINADGHVISPGFIDMLSYSPNGYGEWWKIADGVTSNIGMHGLRFDPTKFFEDWTGNSPVHFGGAVHNSQVRLNVGFDLGTTAAGDEITSIANAVEAQIRAGYIGIHTQPEYTPGVSANEMVDMGALAERLGVPFTVHARFSDNAAPGLQSDATAELIDVARQTGAHVHIEHLNSTGGTGRMEDALAEIEAARAEGLRMTACMYPYEFWATTLQTSRFTDWQERYGLSYGDLQVAGTTERLTESTFETAYNANKLTAAFAIPPEDLVAGFGASFMMVGSDAILEPPHNNHPRSTGCFSRVLGEFVRNQGVVSLMDALAMMTIRPADLLAIGAPAMQRKGRMQIGADADITVFNPDTIIDNSTIADPAQESTGVQYVLVNGVEVRGAGVNDQSVLPGQAITSRLT